jgi:hypothetical protein
MRKKAPDTMGLPRGDLHPLAIVAPSGRLSSAAIREDFGIELPPARLLQFLPDGLSFAVVAAFFAEVFDILVLLSSATGTVRCSHHPKPAKPAGFTDINS